MSSTKVLFLQFVVLTTCLIWMRNHEGPESYPEVHHYWNAQTHCNTLQFLRALFCSSEKPESTAKYYPHHPNTANFMKKIGWHTVSNSFEYSKNIRSRFFAESFKAVMSFYVRMSWSNVGYPNQKQTCCWERILLSSGCFIRCWTTILSNTLHGTETWIIGR